MSHSFLILALTDIVVVACLQIQVWHVQDNQELDYANRHHCKLKISQYFHQFFVYNPFLTLHILLYLLHSIDLLRYIHLDSKIYHPEENNQKLSFKTTLTSGCTPSQFLFKNLLRPTGKNDCRSRTYCWRTNSNFAIWCTKCIISNCTFKIYKQCWCWIFVGFHNTIPFSILPNKTTLTRKTFEWKTEIFSL